MKFKVDRETLLAKLTKAFHFVPKKTIIPVLDNFYFLLENSDHLTIVANNSSVQVAVWMPTMETDDRENFCVPAKLLLGIVKLLREPEVHFEIKQKATKDTVSTQCIVKCGKSRHTLSCDPAESYIMMNSGSMTNEATFDAKPMKVALSNADTFINPKDNRISLTGISIQEKNNRMMVYSTNGMALSKQIVRPRAITKWEPILIPQSVGTAICHMCNDKDIIDIFHDNSKILVKGETFRITAMLIDAKYPPTDQFFEKEFDGKVALTTFEISDAVNRLDLYTPEEMAGEIVMTIEETKMILMSSDTGDVNEGREEINIENSKSIEAIFPTNEMLKILSCLDCDTFSLMYNSQREFVLMEPIVPEGEAPYQYICNPIFVSRKTAPPVEA